MFYLCRQRRPVCSWTLSPWLSELFPWDNLNSTRAKQSDGGWGRRRRNQEKQCETIIRFTVAAPGWVSELDICSELAELKWCQTHMCRRWFFIGDSLYSLHLFMITWHHITSPYTARACGRWSFLVVVTHVPQFELLFSLNLSAWERRASCMLCKNHNQYLLLVRINTNGVS